MTRDSQGQQVPANLRTVLIAFPAAGSDRRLPPALAQRSPPTNEGPEPGHMHAGPLPRVCGHLSFHGASCRASWQRQQDVAGGHAGSCTVLRERAVAAVSPPGLIPLSSSLSSLPPALFLFPLSFLPPPFPPPPGFPQDSTEPEP